MADENTNPGSTEQTEQTTQEQTLNEQTQDSAEVARLKADLAKMKALMDKAASEASGYKKQLRAHQTAEEAAAEEAKQKQEETEKELADLRRKVARADTVKSVMGKLNTDEAVAGKIADYLYGAEDADGALTELQKIWTAKEKALRMEFGRIPAPGIGSTDGPTLTREQLGGMGYRERAEFRKEHPDEYNKLMGRQLP